MHGLGNDFLVFFGEEAWNQYNRQHAITFCQRYFGVGADGLVYILPSLKADLKMRIINADGSEAEECGNAVRCVAKYAYDLGVVDRLQMTVETMNGAIKHVFIEEHGGKAQSIRVDMGKPILAGEKIPTVIAQPQVVNHLLEINDRQFRFTAVSMGNPHCIIYVEDDEQDEICMWGPVIEEHELFPKKTNVHFVTVKSRNHIQMSTWERGVGLTSACGTGACAAVVSSILNQYTDCACLVSVPGGDLCIEWNHCNKHVYMTGPAQFVFKGEIE